MRLRSLLTAAVIAALHNGCFQPDMPDCTYRCDDAVGNHNACPDEYTCQKDGYCHKNGTTGTCPYATIDQSAALADLSATPDLSTPPDMAAPPDLSTPPDLTMPTCTDKLKNGDETDVDCGGLLCGPCADGKGCVKATDCVSMTCLMQMIGMSTCGPTLDMTIAPDMTKPLDMTVAPDLVTPLDMTKPLDLTQPGD